MTDDKPGSSATGRPPGRSDSGRARSRREPVTLEQKPLSVTVEPVADPAPETGIGEPPPAAAHAESQPATEIAAGAEPDTGAATESAVSAAEADVAGTPAADAAAGEASPQPDAPSPAAGESQVAGEQVAPEQAAEELQDAEEQAARDEVPAAPARQGLAGGLVVALLAGGIAGAAVSTGLQFLLNTDGVPEQRVAALERSVATAADRVEVQAAARAAEEASSLNTAVAARVTALEDRIGQLAERLEATPETPAGAEGVLPGGVLPEAALDEVRAELGRVGEALAAARGEIADVGRRTEAFAGQIGGVEQTVAALDPARVREVVEEREGLNARLAGLEETVRERLAGVDLERLAAAADTQAGEIARLATRVTTTEGAVAETERRTLAANAASSERVVVVARLAVLERVAAALAHGQAFPAEIDTLSRLGVDATSLAPLSGATGGLATPSSLAASFANSAAAFPVGEDLPADAGIVDRLAASASRIVRIRPVDGEPDASDTAGQVEASLRRNDAEAALAAWRRLPEGARAQTAALAETLQRRVDAETALAALTQAQIRVLEAPPAAGQGG